MASTAGLRCDGGRKLGCGRIMRQARVLITGCNAFEGNDHPLHLLLESKLSSFFSGGVRRLFRTTSKLLTTCDKVKMLRGLCHCHEVEKPRAARQSLLVPEGVAAHLLHHDRIPAFGTCGLWLLVSSDARPSCHYFPIFLLCVPPFSTRVSTL